MHFNRSQFCFKALMQNSNEMPQDLCNILKHDSSRWIKSSNLLHESMPSESWHQFTNHRSQRCLITLQITVHLLCCLGWELQFSFKFEKENIKIFTRSTESNHVSLLVCLWFASRHTLMKAQARSKASNKFWYF